MSLVQNPLEGWQARTDRTGGARLTIQRDRIPAVLPKPTSPGPSPPRGNRPSSGSFGPLPPRRFSASGDNGGSPQGSPGPSSPGPGRSGRRISFAFPLPNNSPGHTPGGQVTPNHNPSQPNTPYSQPALPSPGPLNNSGTLLSRLTIREGSVGGGVESFSPITASGDYAYFSAHVHHSEAGLSPSPSFLSASFVAQPPSESGGYALSELSRFSAGGDRFSTRGDNSTKPISSSFGGDKASNISESSGYREMQDGCVLPFLDRSVEVRELIESNRNRPLFERIRNVLDAPIHSLSDEQDKADEARSSQTSPTVQSEADVGAEAIFQFEKAPETWSFADFLTHCSLPRSMMSDDPWSDRLGRCMNARSHALWEELRNCLGIVVDEVREDGLAEENNEENNNEEGEKIFSQGLERLAVEEVSDEPEEMNEGQNSEGQYHHHGEVFNFDPNSEEEGDDHRSRKRHTRTQTGSLSMVPISENDEMSDFSAAQPKRTRRHTRTGSGASMASSASFPPGSQASFSQSAKLRLTTMAGVSNPGSETLHFNSGNAQDPLGDGQTDAPSRKKFSFSFGKIAGSPVKQSV